MNSTDLVLTERARSAAVKQYARAYDRHAEEEQVLVALGDYDGAEEAHVVAMIVLRAYRRELDEATR